MSSALSAEDELKRRFAACLEETGSVSELNLDGGGGPPHDSNMERRVGKLEDKMDNVQATLNDIKVILAEMRASAATKDDVASLRSDFSPVRADISAIKATLEGKASASSVAELKGRIDSLPGIAKISAVVALIGAALKLGPMIFGH